MDSILRRCRNCGRYTMRKDKCPYCGGELEVPHPPKYSPEDRYGRQRLLMKVMSGRIKLSRDIMDALISGHSSKQ
ncbi:RNA-protein complex protein Nop10 [Vulcanisaeta souniana]|uniref:Ribosome biogenesis protein Nop10 n=1 Tax=Vulcanisaeta souniana JCM 11219 TaxID=1293586 RepID=A0A830E356_9CREN|nr:RNA-protein complex protein Nop10 [Vulcanisaeta souniana]BDR93491.1 ribosome biogenesis protein Nop10 [Vulcanisaeta souniana JCM 11219]GGI77549.1 ribosome biogenesis protein Nop10 [Vulcanisaeta souniana JCM 11219]